MAGFPSESGVKDGLGTFARFNEPAGLALNPAKAVVDVADTANNALRAMTISTYEVTTLVPQNGGLVRPTSIAAAPAGDTLYVSGATATTTPQTPLETSARLVRVDVSDGTVEPINDVNAFLGDQTLGLAVNPEGTLLYVSDTSGGRLLVASVGVLAAAANGSSPQTFFVAGVQKLSENTEVPRTDLATPWDQTPVSRLPERRDAPGLLRCGSPTVYRRVRRVVIRPATVVPRLGRRQHTPSSQSRFASPPHPTRSLRSPRPVTILSLSLPP